MNSDRNAKERQYGKLVREAEAVLVGETDPIIWMSTLACLIKIEFGFLWVGFYLFNQGELTIGPYQGNLGCLRISLDQGVCGTCANRRQTVVVSDVRRFPGHISCDYRSQSEIVIPVFDDDENLKAVLDIDSSEVSSFDELDRRFLEELAAKMRGLRWSRIN